MFFLRVIVIRLTEIFYVTKMNILLKQQVTNSKNIRIEFNLILIIFLETHLRLWFLFFLRTLQLVFVDIYYSIL